MSNYYKNQYPCDDSMALSLSAPAKNHNIIIYQLFYVIPNNSILSKFYNNFFLFLSPTVYYNLKIFLKESKIL